MNNRFTKIDADGNVLPLAAEEWAIVYDQAAGLLWTAHDVGDKRLTHKQAEAACKKLKLAGAKDWRLPTFDELSALADRARYNPAIDTRFFPDCKSAWYWTSTDAAWSSSAAWVVGFYHGDAYSAPRDYTCFVRAVRSVSAPPAGQ